MKFKKLVILLQLITLIFIINVPLAFAANDEPSLTAKAALLIDTNTGKILYSKNEDKKLYPASTTKILTAILTLENCKLNDVVTVESDIDSTIPYGYTTVELQIGEKFTVEQLLELLMVHSANDVANLLAIHVGGSVESFASMMNTKVYELGLSNTHFTNPSGIHDDNHYTTARDLATIMQYCIKNEDFRRFSGMASCALPATNKHDSRNYESTNKLIVPNDSNYYSYVTCGKTGYTTESGECLVSCAYKNDLEFLCVVLGGDTINGVSTRFSETKSLYEYGYNNFSIKNIINQNDFVKQIKIKNGTINTRDLNLLSNGSINKLLPNSVSVDDLEYNINLNKNISAPIKQDDVLGNISYVIDNEEYKIDLIASHSVEKSHLVFYVMEILIGLALVIVVVLILHNRKKAKLDSE